MDSQNQLVPLLTDFGLASFSNQKKLGVAGFETVTVNGLSIHITPSEVFINTVDGNYFAVDIYAYGIVLYEIVSRTQAWSGLNNEQIKQQVMSSQRPQFSSEVQNAMAQDAITGNLVRLINMAWVQNPLMRPDASRIQQFLS